MGKERRRERAHARAGEDDRPPEVGAINDELDGPGRRGAARGIGWRGQAGLLDRRWDDYSDSVAMRRVVSRTTKAMGPLLPLFS